MALTWGADTSGGTQLTTVDNATEEFFDTIDSSNAYQTQVEVLADNESGSVVDALLVAVYLTLDTASYDWDDQAFMSFTFLPTAITQEKMTFVLPNVFTWRIGCLSAGATDLYTVDMNYRELTAV
jgi:hypothetical protein